MTEKIKVIDSFYEQMENNLNLDTKDSTFGKEYTVKNSDSSAIVLKRFFFDNKYEVCFLNCNGKTTYEYQNPEGKESREDIIEIVYYYSGKTKMISQPGNKTYNLKKGDIGIYSYKNNNILYCFEHDNASAISINLYVGRI
ncbi:MAG: hypothetical protein Q4D53_07960, partial [Leptotrichiaceae bacterium]|nr:hypothetical protein [Leptotrichiaceae bacterium]